jgi:arylsulfatase A-like enzyme
MVRRVLFACAIVLAVLWPNLATAMERQPNIVFIISDDHRWDCIGAAGNPLVHTPAIDRMAREGVYFREGTVVIPQCSPMRAQLMTGRLPHQNGWYSNQTQREDAKGPKGLKGPFLPQVMREAGYQTVLVGKWHLQIEPWESGFEQVRVWLPGGSSPYRDTELAHGNSRERKPVKGYTNVLFGDDAVEFIKKDATEEKPFFLWLALTAPHTPLRPNPPRIQKLYEGKETPDLLPPGFPSDIKPGNFKHYYEAISLADEITGNVIEALEHRGMLENTVVVFMGDNGFMMGSKGIGAGGPGKVVPYEE